MQKSCFNKFLCTVLGPPGAGKGTLSLRLRDLYGIMSMSPGEEIRRIVSSGQGDLSVQLKEAISMGHLVSDQLVDEIVRNRLTELLLSAEGIILDGYPRTVEQAKTFLSFLKEKVKARVFVFVIKADRNLLEKRMSNRLICKNLGCQATYSKLSDSERVSQNICERCDGELAVRLDDNPAGIKNRLDKYEDMEQQLVNFYEQNGIEVLRFNGDEPSVDALADTFSKIVISAESVC